VRAKSNWVKTKEQLPPENTDVLGFTKYEEFAICSYFTSETGYCRWRVNGSSGGRGTFLEVKAPIFWMPLPQPPE